MSVLILTGMAACFILLVAAVLAHRDVTQEPRQEADHGPDCRHCAELRHPSLRPDRPCLTTVPRQRSNR